MNHQGLAHIHQYNKAQLLEFYEAREAEALSFRLIEHFYNVTKTDILINKEVDHQDINTVLERLYNHEPIQYILGYEYFFGHKFYVDNSVLIPRPETEQLVDIALDFAKKLNNKNLKVLDLCTGSGCIAISLALALPLAQVWALELSEPAINTAKKNATNLGAKINFIAEDIFCFSSDNFQKFDLIISNPPYVTHQEKALMHANVVNHEPSLALFVDDTQALVYYETIAQIADKSLTQNGLLVVEINERFGKETAQLFENHGFSNIIIHKDFHEKDRFVSAIRK